MNALGATVATVAIAAHLGCGDNTQPNEGLPPLVEDPATETGCVTTRPGPTETRAKRVACEDELLDGRMAAGRVGDFVLENSRIRVIVRGPGDGLYLYGTRGGALIDAAQHGADDLLQEVVPLVEFNTGLFSELVVSEAGDDGAAEVTVRGVAAPTPLFASALGTQPANVIIEQRYRLAPDDIALAIETRVYSQPDAGEPNEVVGLIDGLFLGGRVKPRFPAAVDGATRGPFLASTGSSTSYGFVLDKTAASVITLREVVFFELLELPTLSVDGDSLVRYLVVGDGSLSSVVDRGWQLYGDATETVSGTTASNVDVVARTESGAVATIARSDADGAFAFDVRPGGYTVASESLDRIPGAPVPIVVNGAITGLVVTSGERGGIEITATADTEPTVARVVVRGLEAGSDITRTVYTRADGTALIKVPPGTYSVDVSKGMEYDAFSANNFNVPAGSPTALVAPLSRVLATDGWISLDPHIHSEMSIDSNVPLDERLLSIAGEGVEVAVSSDHDFIVDYAPVASELGLDSVLATMPGQESSSLIIGHVNAWPSLLEPDKPGGGALAWYGNGPRTVFELARGDDPNRIVQVNHPWDPLGLFTAIGFDRATLMATRSGADLGIPGADLSDFSFDALEVGNKKTEDSFDRAFGDWLALVSAGFPITATGASDSHGDDAYVGEARTFVYVGAGQDDPQTIDPTTLNDAIRRHNVVVGQGIFVVAGIVGPVGETSLPGELVDLSGETDAVVRISVQAPPWLPVSAVVVYERDVEIMRVPVDTTETQAVRFSSDISFPLDGRDTLFVVVAEAGGDGRPVMDQPKPSFTNPLYVDANGNGSFEPE